MFTTTAANIAAQRQGGLFDDPAAPADFELTAPQPKMARDGWIGHPGHPGLMGTSRAGSWTHPSLPGVTIKHCGHPTALRPYYVEGIEWLTGLTHINLSDAKHAATWMSGDPLLQLQRKGVRIVEGSHAGSWYHTGPQGNVGPLRSQGLAVLVAGRDYGLLPR